MWSSMSILKNKGNLLVVTGGSASGKSEYAEGRAVSLAGRDGGSLVYLAAMMPSGEDARMRIERHQRLRAGKGFETIERYRDIYGLCCGDSRESVYFREKAAGGTVLLECMSNLTANEMFAETDTSDRIPEGITALRELVRNLVIVTIDVFGDGQRYDPETERYRRCLGLLNQELAAWADEVVEVVCGIPLIHKKTEEEQECIH